MKKPTLPFPLYSLENLRSWTVPSSKKHHTINIYTLANNQNVDEDNYHFSIDQYCFIIFFRDFGNVMSTLELRYMSLSNYESDHYPILLYIYLPPILLH